MRCGHLYLTKRTGNGCGWHWIQAHRKSLGFTLVNVIVREQKVCGNRCPQFITACAVCYTDFWSAYEQVFPKSRHQAVSKQSGKTNHIERLNCTLRQQVSRLVRQTLSLSKKLENHIGAIWYFIHHHNESLLM